jgi:hypothetical protein
MAGTVTPTASAVPHSGGVSKMSLAWTCDASGNVSGNSLTMEAGSLVVVEFVPGAGGVQPTDLYDVDFLDAGGASMFDDGTGTSIGANLSNSVALHRVPMMYGKNSTAATVRAWLQGPSGGNPYQLTVANAGNAKSGTVNIFQISGVL